MYCETCQADVAAEISADGKALLCTTCGSNVKRTSAPSLSSEAQSARDLLERWSRDELLDPYGPAETQTPSDQTPSDQTSNQPPAATPPQTPAPPQSQTPAQPPRAARPQPPGQPPTPPQQPDAPRGEAPQPPRPKAKFRVDPPAAQPPQPVARRQSQTPPSAKPGPHFRVDAGHTPATPSQPPATQPTDDVMAELTSADDFNDVFADANHPNAAPDANHPNAAADASPPAAASQPPAEQPPMQHAPTVPPAPVYAEVPAGYRVDAAEQSVAAPHFSTESFQVPTGKAPGRFESLAGQLLAYGGVALLTVGTALVLYGYFGGGGETTATGWLVATIGQMLLFLGVVTLISGGMQQTTHEVGSRVQYLGERIIRLESSQQTLAGPHYARERVESGVASGRKAS